MRVDGYALAAMLRDAKGQPTGLGKALLLGRLRAARALYETSVYARFSFPQGAEQCSLRTALAVCAELRNLGQDVRNLRAQIKEARHVPLDLDW
jgi:hypothetical protein